MRTAWRSFSLCLGLGLLSFLLYQTDLSSLGQHVLSLGALGLLVVLLTYFLAFAADSLSWQLAIPSVGLNARWLTRLFIVRMVGEAWNNITPLAGMGGEPVKAVLLKRYHGLGYREAAASLLLARTTNLIALLPFLGIGFWLLLGDPRIASTYGLLAAMGLAALATGVVLLYLVQRLRLSSLAGTRVVRSRLGSRLSHGLKHIKDIDERLVEFYTRAPQRFAGALALAIFNWALGAVELFWVMWFVGEPISFADAWIIEAVAQLVRVGTFFIPASIGAQEGILVVIVGALTGNPVLGLAVALIRRVREALWIAAGLGLGWWVSFRPEHSSRTGSAAP